MRAIGPTTQQPSSPAAQLGWADWGPPSDRQMRTRSRARRVQLVVQPPRRPLSALQRTQWLGEEDVDGIKVVGFLHPKDYYTLAEIEDCDQAQLKDVSSMHDFASLRAKQKVLALCSFRNQLFPVGYYLAEVVHDRVKGEGLLFKERYKTIRLVFEGF